MKILFIDPPGRNKGINTGLGYISAVLDGKYEVFVLDLNNIEFGFCGDPNPEMSIKELHNRIMQTIEEFDPDLIGISVKTFTAGLSSHIFKFVKIHRPSIITIAGGPHITLDGIKFIRQNDIDFGVRGEGEYTTLKLCNCLAENNRIENIKGIYYRRNNHIIDNQMSHPIEDMDKIPFPEYDRFSSVIENDGFLKEYPLLTSRGCPYQCSYCSMPAIMGRRWRFHSPLRVLEELKHIQNKYHSTSFTVIDDNFTLDLNRVEEICDLMVAERVNLPWNSQNGIRADKINEKLANKIKSSGCKAVWIGIENADPNVFNSLHKGERLEDIERGIQHLKNEGIWVGGFFITGLPHSTRESDLKSVQFVKKHNIEGWWFHFVPYPHTEAWEWVQRNASILRSSNGALQYGKNDIEPVFETNDYPKDDRMKTYDEIHIEMNYFDRLINPSKSQWMQWKRVAKKVFPFGFQKFFQLIFFIVKFNVKRIIGKIHG